MASSSKIINNSASEYSDDSSVSSSEPVYLSDREEQALNDTMDTSCADRNVQYLPDTTQFFSEETKVAFHRMICSPSHKNKSRPSAAKYELLNTFAAEPSTRATT